ncbi:enoyl-CoA hydratase [Chelatococcus reniformis]|uniref:Enoyl-CoA hydratase n=1 Tax=Chelatococcus reniformis TaxID=1494448 RepID=A0A916TWF5_9HYPH|nr:enoyl-CoA hydratase [Chelatococcus reniformis]GGC46709.1 enoyl-CoA hydratase [Chelatococcus reniformis]
MPDLVIERSDAIATITLNRPDAMNALSKALRRDLADAINGINADDAIRVVILTGAGHRAFTAGLDLKELGHDQDALGAANAETADRNPVKAIEMCTKPVIGAINGVAITGGFELALACDVLIASVDARFADTHGRVGIMPGWGLSQKLSRLVGLYRAKELSLTGNFIDAQTAQAWGLVNRVVARDELMPQARQLAAEMAQLEPVMLVGLKRLIDDGFGLPLDAALALEQERSIQHNRAVTPAAVEARRAAVQARGRTQ